MIDTSLEIEEEKIDIVNDLYNTREVDHSQSKNFSELSLTKQVGFT
jgi:hypothetical protein